MKDYNVYLFDFDGCLVDSLESMEYIYLSAFEKVGLKAKKEEVIGYMREPLDKTFLDRGGKIEDYPEFVKWIIFYLDDKKSILATKLFDDTLKIIDFLKKKNKKIGIITSNSTKHVLEVLEHLNIDKNIFDVIVAYDSTKKHKPDPDPVLKGLELLNAQANNEAVYVGDALDDMKAGKGAGIDTILIDRFGDHNDYKETKIVSLMELVK